MNETHTIEAAYERLATSLAEPTDADRLVAERLTSRRRRRRTGQGAVAAVAVVATLGGVALVGSGSPTSAPQRSTSYADTTAPTTATDPTTEADEPTAPATADPIDVDELCALTGDEAVRLIRERYNGLRAKLEIDRDGQRIITLEGLRRLERDERYLTHLVADCR